MQNETEEEGQAGTGGRFSFGNQAWKARSTHGRRPRFTDPDVLLEACQEYFQWCHDNPLMAAEVVKFQGVGTLMSVPKMRAMTIRGLCAFLDIDRTTWAAYGEKTDFSAIVSRVEDAIYQSKIEGTAAEMLNPSIIARELGLSDKTEVDTTLTGIAEVRVIEVPAKAALPAE